MSKHYEYADASCQQVGLMNCCVCGKKITKGEYRYHETRDAYVPCHRECCSADKMWTKLDIEAKARKDWDEAYEQACKDFLKEWGSFPDEGCYYCSS